MLFCVSAGNIKNSLQLGIEPAEFSASSSDEQVSAVLSALYDDRRNRRILAPSESINSITVGALHDDASTPVILDGCLDILPSSDLPSPLSPFGHGFRSSIKPEILVPGGRQLFTHLGEGEYDLPPRNILPRSGQKVAAVPVMSGDRTRTVYTCGTSNANALAVRGAAFIHDAVLDVLEEQGLNNYPFPENELSSWWLAYDAACLANKELVAADMLLKDNHHSQRFAARSITGVHSPEIFAKHVPTDGWTPVDTAIKITDIKSVVERFGGEKLYGRDPSAALRELLQNAVDAVHACRSLDGIGANEGEIEIALEDTSGGHWLHVTDTGIGMSRYVLTEVLIDFGRSLWRSADLRGEWCGLASSGFEAIGQFGVGFFSVFMLGESIRVVSRRYDHKDGEDSQWLLNFSDGTNKRPTLRAPVGKEKLKRHGTRVSVLISKEKLNSLCKQQSTWSRNNNSSTISLVQACARLAPAVDVNLYVKTGSEGRQLAVKANDWLALPPIDLLRRIIPGYLESTSAEQFGLWTHLAEVYDDNGCVIGRCAVQPLLYLGPKSGIGVVKGLLAGNVDGISGIIMSKQQSDLARREAIPDIFLSALQRWAESQKELLLKNGKLTVARSALLAFFGASHNALKTGEIGGEAVSREEFIDVVSGLDEIVVHSGEISYDSDDDVKEKDFEKYFEVNEDLLVLPQLVLSPKWIDQIESDVAREFWSLDSALEEALVAAWGQVDWLEETVPVGFVNGNEISRYCRIATRLVE